MGREATLHLLKQGVRVTGTDGWSWDAPFSFTHKHFIETGDASLIWEGHKAGRDIGYCHMEKLTNLDQLPPSGFKVCCFPVKIRRPRPAGPAAWQFSTTDHGRTARPSPRLRTGEVDGAVQFRPA